MLGNRSSNNFGLLLTAWRLWAEFGSGKVLIVCRERGCNEKEEEQ